MRKNLFPKEEILALNPLSCDHKVVKKINAHPSNVMKQLLYNSNFEISALTCHKMNIFLTQPRTRSQKNIHLPNVIKQLLLYN